MQNESFALFASLWDLYLAEKWSAMIKTITKNKLNTVFLLYLKINIGEFRLDHFAWSHHNCYDSSNFGFNSTQAKFIFHL